MLTVCINFNALPSWLILEPLEGIQKRTGVSLDWQPLLSDPIHGVGTAQPSKNPDDGRSCEDNPLAVYKARRAKARANFLRREAERACDRLGIDYEVGCRTIDPLYLSLGILWMKAANAAPPTYFDYCRMAWQQLFARNNGVINSPEPGVINSPETTEGVTSLLGSLGLSTKGFSTFIKNETKTLEVNQSKLLEMGVLRAPAFILEDEVFIGRQHLPLLTWILEGKVGLPPV